MVSWEGKKLHVVITDFGVANFADSSPLTTSLSKAGAAAWMAPEILIASSGGQPGMPIKHTRASDIYSFVMLMLLVRIYIHVNTNWKVEIAIDLLYLSTVTIRCT